MPHKNIRRYLRHHIPQKSSANTCQCTEKSQQECIVHIAGSHTGFDTKYRKNTKPDRIHHQHDQIIVHSHSAFKKLLFKIKDQKYKQRCGSSHGHILRIF